MEKIEDSETFVNSFETCVNKLKEHKSKAVDNMAFMRVLILHSMWAEEFWNRKLEITSDLNMSTAEIIDTVRQHFLAMKTNEELTGTKTSSKKVSVY